MSKVITLRVDDSIYDLFKKAANGYRRPISNYVEFAALSYLTEDIFVSDEEMSGIENDAQLAKTLKKGLKDIKNDRYRII